MSFFTKIAQIQTAVCAVVKDKYTMTKGTETYNLDTEEQLTWYELAVRLGHIEDGVEPTAYRFVNTSNGTLVDPDDIAEKATNISIRQNADSKG